MDVCAVCAWRETCQKKFSISGKDLRCPDFARDVTIKEKTEEDKEEKKKEGRVDIQQVLRLQGRAVWPDA